MMRINLLPLRAARRQVSARQELVILGATLGVVLAVLFGWWSVQAAKIGSIEERVEALRREMESVKKDVKRVEEFKKKTELLERKLKVIDELKKKKVGPAKMLDELARVLTEQRKVWLTKVEEKDGVLVLEGGAMEEENISEFQIALGRRSKIFSEIKLSLMSAQKKGAVSYLEWKLTLKTNYTG